MPIKWIAIADDDEVIATGKTIKEVREKAKKAGCNDPIITAPVRKGEAFYYANPVKTI